MATGNYPIFKLNFDTKDLFANDLRWHPHLDYGSTMQTHVSWSNQWDFISFQKVLSHNFDYIIILDNSWLAILEFTLLIGKSSDFIETSTHKLCFSNVIKILTHLKQKRLYVIAFPHYKWDSTYPHQFDLDFCYFNIYKAKPC